MKRGKPVRVVHLITLLEMGGAQGNTIHTVKTLDSSKYETHLWCGKGAYWDAEVEKTLAPQGRLKFFPHLKRSIHPLLDILIIFELTAALKKLQPAIVHTHSSKAGIVGRIAAHLAHVPVVVHTYHGFGFHPYQSSIIRMFFVLLEKWTARFARKLIFVSESNRTLAQTLKIGSPDQYTLIRSGVPLVRIRHEAKEANASGLKRSIGVPQDSQLIVSVGPFKPQKNFSDFIRVAIDLAPLHPKAHFLIIGDGILRHQLERQIKVAKMGNRIQLLGWRRDVAQWLAISDVFAMTSLWEGLPRSMLEALYLGVPAICYDTDGVRDLLSKGGGILIPQQDIRRFKEELDHLLKDDSLRLLFGKQARAIVGKEFDIDEMVTRQDNLYSSLLSSLSSSKPR